MPLLGGHFDDIQDPRRCHGKLHDLSDIFALALCAVIAGADTFVAIEAFGHARLNWLRRFIPLANGVPSHDTLARVFALIDRDHFERAFAAWAAEAFERTAECVAQEEGHGEAQDATPPLVAIDGKRLRRARDADKTALSVVSAWATESRMALAQVTTTQGEGEVSALPRLLALLDLSGCIVTLDAGGCQTDVAEAISSGGGDYVITVKGNQGELLKDCRAWLSQARQRGLADSYETAERGHGREEVRRYWCATVPEEAQRRVTWRGLESVGMVEAQRTDRGKTSVERRMFITSLPADAEALARAVRGHWGVENGLHWVLDVAFREDESRARLRHAAANLAVVRRLAATLIKADTSSKGGVQTRRMRAAWDGDYLARLLQLE